MIHCLTSHSGACLIKHCMHRSLLFVMDGTCVSCSTATARQEHQSIIICHRTVVVKAPKLLMLVDAQPCHQSGCAAAHTAGSLQLLVAVCPFQRHSCMAKPPAQQHSSSKQPWNSCRRKQLRCMHSHTIQNCWQEVAGGKALCGVDLW